MKLTKQQQLAVNLDGNSLLVSAAAGSGKTSVLSKRVIRKLTDENSGSDADKLVILTYTNAAAAEMRARIVSGLREILKENPDNVHIKKQLMLLPAAKICTIHSACLDILRSNFQLCEIDPQFTIAEENKLSLMRTEELEDFVEEIYDLAEQKTEIKEVISFFTRRRRDDTALINAIDVCSAFLEKQPYEQKFIDYACSVCSDKILEFMFDYLEEEISDITLRYEKLIEKATQYPKLVDFYSNERDFASLISKHITDRNYDLVLSMGKELSFKNHPPKPKDESADVWNLFKNTRNDLKARLINIFIYYIYTDRQSFEKDRQNELGLMKTLLELCSTFNKRLFEKRRKQRLVSFDDIEKYALKLLIQDISDGKIQKTVLAKELSENIDEIIVDEFQDCNYTQDLIFTALSKDCKNIFMVGDVKQSIYRFRNAQPEIFLEKQKNSVIIQDECELVLPSRIDLSCNFRSHKNVIDFVNSVFDPLMTKDCGGIDYLDGHRLVSNPNAKKTCLSEVELDFLVTETAEGEPLNKLSKTEAEAKFVADKISYLLKNGKIYDVKKGVERPVLPSDIAILMRAPKTDSRAYEKALEKEGIAFINNNPSENCLDTAEVRSVLAYLQVIDNPYDDIPLVTLMYSDFFGFSAKQLAQIRSKNRYCLFYDAVKAYSKKDSKTSAFIEKVEYLRTLALTTDVYGIISAVYESSGIMLKVSSKKNGDSIKANLMLLLEHASNFESSRYRGLFAFINYIIRLTNKNESIPAAKLKKSGNCVNILSIHRSKGLEYPVIFLVGAGDTLRFFGNDDVQLDQELGVGCHIFDDERHIDFSSPCRSLIERKDDTQQIEEYMRLLYVALTRAVSHLYVTGSFNVSNIEKTVTSAYMADGKPEKYDVYDRPSFMKWILFSQIKNEDAKKLCAFTGVPTDLCTEQSSVKIKLCDISEMTASEPEKKPEQSSVVYDKEQIKNLINRKYQYEYDVDIPSKLSVSEIKGMKRQDEDKTSLKKSSGFKKPRFMQGITGADRGNATHKFLQFCDFKAIFDKESFENEKSRLLEYEFITKNDADIVDEQKILEFLANDIMKDLEKNSVCEKEQRFLFTLPANEIMDTPSSESVIVQGIIDCLYIKDGKVVIVDYKTDTVKDEKTLIDRYGVQLDMYQKAIKHTRGLDTAHKYIYSFCLGKMIEV